MKFPYGVSDFYKIVTEDYFYLDRTAHIRLVEETGPQLLFLRPRRFGKSLWLSTLENYYDVAKADEFERLFGNLVVGMEPTPLHNRYLVIKWDFSLVAAHGETGEIKRALHDHINEQIAAFSAKYEALLGEPVRINWDNGIASFEAALSAVQRTPYRLYLLIDEYDNFANEVMTTSQTRYQSLLSGEGLLKTVFKAVKAGSAGRGLDRVFITGVSPVVMSDITSGYNIAENIYLRPEFNDLCGFTEDEVRDTLHRVAQECALSPSQADGAVTMARTFYDGYCFSPHCAAPVYNPTLVLYLAKSLLRDCRYPEDLLDENLAMDRDKVTYISQLPGGESVILDALREDAPLVIQRLARRFGVADMLTAKKDVTFMTSLLYYFGVLTLAGYTEYRELELRIPNLVVRKLYVERIRDMLLPDAQEQDAGRNAARALYQRGDIQPLCDFVAQRYFRVLDNRDYRWANELTVKVAFLTLLFNDYFYVMDSEPALGREYADLVMTVRPDMRDTPLWDILIEFKYIGLPELGLTGAEARGLDVENVRALPQVEERLAAAKAKLAGYRRLLAEKYGAVLRLRAFAVISIGFERLIWEEIK